MFLLFLEEWQKWWELSKYESATPWNRGQNPSFQGIILLLFLPNESKAYAAFSSSSSFSNFIFDVFYLFASLLESLFWLTFLRMLNTHGFCSHEAYTLGDNTG